MSCRSSSIQGIVSRLSSLFKNLLGSPSSEKKSFRYFSTTASSSNAGYSSFYSISSKRESLIYRNALQCRRPPPITPDKMLSLNSVSFIGYVALPVKINRSNYVWTVLEAKSPAKSNRTLRILLVMRGKMAEISLQHIVQNDFIYVSGYLDSYTKVDSSGGDLIFYKVIVQELNYVIQNNPDRAGQKPESLKLDAVPISRGQPPILDNKKEGNDCLHLWQIFFASPHEWWDNRQKKRYPCSPDFRHKDTGECLWITPNDPPWVARQLQLIDSKMTESGNRDLGSQRRGLSIWEYED